MSYCLSCGEKVSESASFCSSCGTAISRQEKNTDPQLKSEHEFSVENKKIATSIANQVLFGFFFIALCDIKGYHPTRMFESISDLVMFVSLFVILTVITYFCAIYQGINKSKPNFVLGITIVLILITMAGTAENLQNGGYTNNNIWDWFSLILVFAQIIGLIRVYFLVKERK